MRSSKRASCLQRRGDQFEILRQYFSFPLDGDVQLDQVRPFAFLQIERRFTRDPVRRAADRLVDPFREELAAPRKTTPHFQKGAPGESLRLDFRSIREHAVLDLRICKLEKAKDFVPA